MYTREELAAALDHVGPFIEKLADGSFTEEERANAILHLEFLASVPEENYIEVAGHFCCFTARRDNRDCHQHGTK